MSLKYVVRKGSNPQKPGETFYCGRFKMENRLEFKDLCRIISDQCSLTASDVKGIISAMLNVVNEELSNSKIVRLGDFGSFRCEVKGNLVDTADDWTRSKVKGVKLVFTPGTQFKTASKGANLKAYSEPSEE